jgi:aspartyl-tRNA(Asn)/glutamyl-tRNA(Gln) amidotransferase subunit A
VNADIALWSLTATELNQAYATNNCDPVQATEACLARIGHVNPQLNAIVTVNRDGALKAARASQERWRTGNAIGPLDGVPLTIKDNLFVAGLRATWGSRLYENFIAPVDDITIERLRGAGAIILGKTNSPEFSMSGYTDNKVFGATGNPWAPNLSSGGSSGGAASAVMSGMGSLALVTDAGGSTRRPAAHVGCIGLKPSLGRVPRRHGFAPLASDFQSIGLLARSVDDACAMFDVIANPVVENTERPTRVKISAFYKVDDHLVEPEAVAKWSRAAKFFAEMGHYVDEISVQYKPNEMAQFFLGLGAVGVSRVVRQFDKWRNLATESVVKLADKGLETSATDYVNFLDQATAARWRFLDMFDDTDFILTPTTPVFLWPKNEPFQKLIAGQEAGLRDSAIYTTFVNVAGLPAISLPAGLDSNGHPLGIQLIGPMNSENRLLDLARQWEEASPWDTLSSLK